MNEDNIKELKDSINEDKVSRKIKASKNCMEYIEEIFTGNKVDILEDEQKAAHEKIISYVLTSKDKKTIIVNGEIGTGKSIVAMSLLSTLLQHNKKIKFIDPNMIFRTTVIESLASNKYSRKYLSSLFQGSRLFVESLDNEFDILICNEAQKLKGKGANMYRGDNQVEDIIRTSKVNIFFTNDDERISPEEIGTVKEIKKIAERYNSEIEEIKLESQFESFDKKKFLEWVDYNFQIKDNMDFKKLELNDFDFKIMDNPNSLYNLIEQKNKEGFNARILAGFAWKWTAKEEGNPAGEIKDVSIPEYEFSMPWNAHNIGIRWAMKEEGKKQVGCIHTVQGLKFDYVGVIIGKDLYYDVSSMKIYSNYDEYFDRLGKMKLKDNQEELVWYIKRIYKILMSRGIRGCYIFCRDENLQKYLKSKMTLN